MAPPETEGKEDVQTAAENLGAHLPTKVDETQLPIQNGTQNNSSVVEPRVEEAVQGIQRCTLGDSTSAVETAGSRTAALPAYIAPLPDLPPGVRRCVELQQVVINEDPRIVLFKNFLNDEEIEYLLKLTDGKFRPSLTGTADAYELNAATNTNRMTLLQEKTSSNRTSFSCVLNTEDPVVRIIVRRVAFVAGYPEDHVERLSVLRYEPGQYFKEHHDGQFRPRTVFIYLNTVPEGDGGETQFPRLGLRFRPTKGVAFMWTNPLPDGTADMRVLHQALPPKTSTKYAMNCFVNEIARTPHPPNTESIVH